MTTLSNWPEGFERGVPREDGCYACIIEVPEPGRFGGCRYDLAIVDIMEFGRLAADELGVKPGFCVCTPEGDVWNAEDFGVVGYHRVCDNSLDITTAEGLKGEGALLKLNEAGIGFYLKFYERELKKLRVKAWPLCALPPSPPLMPPMPAFSSSFFEEADE